MARNEIGVSPHRSFSDHHHDRNTHGRRVRQCVSAAATRFFSRGGDPNARACRPEAQQVERPAVGGER